MSQILRMYKNEFIQKWASHLNEWECNLLIFQKLTNNFEYHLIDEIKLKDIKEEVLKDLDLIDLSEFNPQDLYEETLRVFARSGSGKLGEFYTPPVLKNLVLQIAKCYDEFDNWKSVYDPTCGTGGLLTTIPNKDKYVGIELKREVSCLADIYVKSLYPDKDIKIYCADALKTDLDEKVDLIVANPPFSVSWEPREGLDFGGVYAPKKCADFAFIKHMLNSVKDDGLILTYVFPGVLYRTKAEEQIRKYLVENNLIEAIITLPGNLFNYTTIQTNLLVLRKNKEYDDILLIDLHDCAIKGHKQNTLTDETVKECCELFKAFLKGDPLPKTDWERFSSNKPLVAVINPDQVKQQSYNLIFNSYSQEPEDPNDEFRPDIWEEPILGYEVKQMFKQVELQKILIDDFGSQNTLREKFLSELAPHIESFYNKYKDYIEEKRKIAYEHDDAIKTTKGQSQDK